MVNGLFLAITDMVHNNCFLSTPESLKVFKWTETAILTDWIFVYFFNNKKTVFLSR